MKGNLFYKLNKYIYLLNYRTKTIVLSLIEIIVISLIFFSRKGFIYELDFFLFFSLLIYILSSYLIGRYDYLLKKFNYKSKLKNVLLNFSPLAFVILIFFLTICGVIWNIITIINY